MGLSYQICPTRRRHLVFSILVFCLRGSQQQCVDDPYTLSDGTTNDVLINHDDNDSNINKCDHESCSNILDFSIKLDSRDNTFLYEMGNVLMLECELTTVNLISDKGNFINYVMKTLRLNDLPYSRYEHTYYLHKDDNESLDPLRRFIHASYVTHNHDFYVLAVDRPGQFLSQVEAIFRTQSHSRLALLPHKTKWMVLVWTERQWKEIVAQQFTSVLDNVAVLKMQMGPSFHFETRGIETFMWRQNRKREPSTVDLNSSDKKRCDIFPNKHSGLNGRELIVGPKAFYKLFLRKETSPHTGKVDFFKGILVDVLTYSSLYSNFTYVLDNSSNEVSWNRYVKLVANGHVDIGLSVWSSQFQITYNLSFSYPVVFDAIVGIYRLPDQKRFANSWVFLCPFPPLGYAILFPCLFYVSTIYTLISEYWRNKKLPDRIGDHKHPNSSFQYESKNQETDNEKKRVKLYDIFAHGAITLFAFSVAILNQSYLPRSRRISSQLIVGVWALGLVFFYAIFSSSITAQMVRPKDDVPFSTIEGFLSRRDYSCTVLNRTILMHSLEVAKEGTILDALRSKTTLIELWDEEKQLIDNDLPHYLKNLQHNVVFFHYESAIETWLQNQDDAEDYVVMDKDPIYTADLSIIFAPTSELQEIMSSAIRKIHESGYQLELTKYNKTSFKGDRNQRSSGNQHRPIKIYHMFWLAMICLTALLMSVSVLGLEVLQDRWTAIISTPIFKRWWRNITRKRAAVQP